ncbi:MAG: glycosyl hydrolase-related protein, partial [Gemmatimonadaceae bacterium]
GEGLAFGALKESEDGGWIIARCVNLTEHDVHGRWRFARAIADAKVARLDETPVEPQPAAMAMQLDGNEVSFTAGARGVVTLLVRPAG